MGDAGVEAEVEFTVPVTGGTLHGRRRGKGPPALLLHGGPALPDYTGNCAAELQSMLHLVRYTPRGVAPSDAPGPYTVEAHVDDALAVLDHLGLERAGVIGHSWGGHLAMRLACLVPERVACLILIAPLGVSPRWLAELGESLRAGLDSHDSARLEQIDAARRERGSTEAELRERWRIVWPGYFANPAGAPPCPVARIGARASDQTNASLWAELTAGTLARTLPWLKVPTLIVHGADDPLPASGSFELCGLLEGALLEVVHACGHFPWIESPGALRDATKDFLSSLP